MFDFNDKDFINAVSDEYKIYNFEQNSHEWYAIKLGKLTASNIATLTGESQTRKTLIYEKASSIITGIIPKQIYSEPLIRGRELESNAKDMYEFINDVEVKQVGFVELNKFVGASPDGLIGDIGLVEFKCPKPSKFMQQIIEGKTSIEKLYIYQMQMQIYVCGKQWCDYVIYNEDFKNPIHTIRIERDEEIIADIKETIDRAITDIKEIITIYKQRG